MANSKRKANKGKPISSHPLFPAVVALWFGALFGLASLAIRPSLIEELVMKSGIDLIIPAAAPPLGITARILIALTMAGVGAVIGGLLARRMTRPKAEVRVRKRGARAAEDTATETAFRRPISAHDELGASLDAPLEGGSTLAGRRRGLTVAHEERPFEPHELAPLPCGEPPVFLGDEVAPPPLDLGAFPPPFPAAEPGAPQAPGDLATPPVGPAVPGENTAPFAPPAAMPAAPFAPPAGFAAPAPERPVSTPTGFTPPVYSPPPVAVPAAGEPVATPPPAPAGDQPTPSIFGQSAADGQVPGDFIRAAGFRTSVFETDPVSPLFTDRQPLAQPDPAAEAAPNAAAGASPAGLAGPDAPAGAPLPRPADLGMTDLARRLQESMARRRANRAAGAVAAAPPVADPCADQGAAAACVVPQTLAEAAPIAAPLPYAAEPESEPALAPASAAASAPAFAPPPLVPFATRAPAEPLAEPAPAIVAPPLAMPAALRPLSLDLADDEPETGAFDLLPPRHLTMPARPGSPTPEAPAPDTTTTADPAPATAPDEDELDESSATEDAFGSLLSISPAVQRTGFVRIEEPEPAGAAIEPVVIFPGQAPAPTPAMQDPETPFRRFDAPTAAAPAAPVAPTMAPPAVDPAEAEAALRAALANLQRMSGAA